MKRLGILGTIAIILAMLIPATALAQTDTDPDCMTFEETGYSLCDEFLDFWETNGGLAVFGYPLTEAFDEANPDSGQTYLVQYFERQRFELHPENAGTVYNVLFGRIGAQILDEQGRNWHTFPKASPDADHYFETTGHAIAPEFWTYWSSHGLDFGDEGISLRESLLLFGYPLSEATEETNEDGHTVLTQWFERAAFEFHPDNPADSQVLLRRLGAELLTPVEPGGPEAEVIADGLTSPHGIAFDADGAVYVTDAGSPTEGEVEPICIDVGEGEEAREVCIANTGSVLKLTDEGPVTVASGLPNSISDIVISDAGDIYVVTGLGADPALRDLFEGDAAAGYGYVLAVDTETDTWTEVADVAGHETDNNPDEGMIDSNPYGLLLIDGGFLVADAGANAVLHVAMDGTVTTFAVFPPQMVDPPPFIEMPEGQQMPMESVPTSVVLGPDGAYYVSELTGFPFEIGAARVWRVEDTNDDGDALDEGEMTVAETGFTNIVDLAFDSEGHLYVLEIAKNGLLAAEDPNNEDPAAFAGALMHVVDGTATEVTLPPPGLVAPTGMAIGADDTVYVANFGVMPDMGQILKLTGAE